MRMSEAHLKFYHAECDSYAYAATESSRDHWAMYCMGGEL